MDATAMKAVIAVILIGASFIEVPKLKLNLWGIIGSAMKKGILGDVDKRLAEMEKSIKAVSDKVDELDASVERTEAIRNRQRILRFGDELVHNPDLRHTEEHWVQIIEDCKMYDTYCNNHPEFENNRTVSTSKLILDTYNDRLKKGDF